MVFMILETIERKECISCIPNILLEMFQNQIFWTEILGIGMLFILDGKCENVGAENENAPCMIPETSFLL